MRISTHPEPLLERRRWRDLNGRWRFAFDDERLWKQPADARFNLEITVPYPPESRRSGIADTTAHPVIWYSRTVRLEAADTPLPGERLLLHFGAVDYRARVWVNNQLVVEHEGGQTPFSADITETVQDGVLEITVRAEDDPLDMAQPRGKQDWQDEPHGIWHYRSSGIWQTVWLEIVPETRIERLHWTPDLDRWEISVQARISSAMRAELTMRVRLTVNGSRLAEDTYTLTGTTLSRRIGLPDPGIEDVRLDLLWSPEHPQLIEAHTSLLDGDTVLDEVFSYTAMRSAAVAGGQHLLNGQPYYLRTALDQGFWPDGLYTASDEEYRLDVELSKRLGFNGVRKHQKLESPRWLYWCDVLGLLVWEEMPAHYAFTPEAIGCFTREWLAAIERDRSHPCIVAWVPFNESWGVPNLPSSLAQREYVRGLYHLIRALDPTRPVSSNDGWEQFDSDFFNIHDYTIDSGLIFKRYRDRAAILETAQSLRPVGRALGLEGFGPEGKPVLLSEFGAFVDAESTIVGLDRRAKDEAELLSMYAELLEVIHACHGLVGFCYTQLTDVFYERNGLLDMQRQPKADLAGLARATRGPRGLFDEEVDEMGYSRRWQLKQRI